MPSNNPPSTRPGDKGSTSLYSGERIDKTSQRVEAIGAVDELISFLGIARTFSTNAINQEIKEIQLRLFNVANELASKDIQFAVKPIQETDIKSLEQKIKSMNKQLPPLTHFVLPGNSKPGAFLHAARTVCRRAEREILRLSKDDTLNPFLMQYMNRLSDFLFVLARLSNKMKKKEEQLITRDGISSKKK
ncbi:MAG: cob(I)yrinic acid a,c-diamide adenosyltransferase [Promethearchaeota archaeon]